MGTQHPSVLIHIRNKGEVGTSNMLTPSSNYTTDRSKAELLSWIIFVICLFIAALWSPAEKGLTSWFSCMCCFLVLVTFPYGVLGQVWHLIVWIPDICLLPYFMVSCA